MLRRQGVRLPALVAVIVTTGATPAFAGNGLYVGASAGSSLFHADKSDFDNEVLQAFNENGLLVTSGDSTLDKSGITYSGIIGYQFIPQLAIEGSYTDLGKLNYHANDTLSGFTQGKGSAELNAKSKGPTLAVIGALPLSPNWEIYVRAGIFFAKTTLEATANITLNGGRPGSSTDSTSSNSVDPLAGIGLAWRSDHVKIRAEYIRFSNVGDKDNTGEINIDTFNVGITYSF